MTGGNTDTDGTYTYFRVPAQGLDFPSFQGFDQFENGQGLEID